MPETVLVTGGAGFIGSHLCARLLADTDAQVVVVDNFDPFYPRALKEENLRTFAGSGRLRFVELDLRNQAATAALLRDWRPSTIFHLAARGGVRPSIVDPASYAELNVGVTTTLLAEACAVGVRNFVFASSSSVYGNNPKVPFAEDDPVDQPVSPYAATKRAGELLAHSFHRVHGLNVACLRFFAVYGPRQRPDLAVRKFAEAILAGAPLQLFGDGSSARDYTYVDDLTAGVLGAWRWLAARPTPTFETFNLGNSQQVALSTLVALLQEVTGRRAQVQHAPTQGGDVERTFADIRRARDTFAYAPRVDIRDGLGRVVAWLRSRG